MVHEAMFVIAHGSVASTRLVFLMAMEWKRRDRAEGPAPMENRT